MVLRRTGTEARAGSIGATRSAGSGTAATDWNRLQANHDTAVLNQDTAVLENTTTAGPRECSISTWRDPGVSDDRIAAGHDGCGEPMDGLGSLLTRPPKSVLDR